jgi:transposase
MARRERRKFSDEYKAEVVALVRSSEKSIGEISRDLDLTETAVRESVQRADVDGGKRNGLTTAEREELSRLRRQVRVLEEERSILKKAAATLAGHPQFVAWKDVAGETELRATVGWPGDEERLAEVNVCLVHTTATG